MFNVSLLIVLLFVAFSTGQNLTGTDANAIEQALDKGQQIEESVRIAVQEKLPATKSAAAAGNNLLDTVHTGLNHCSIELNQTKQIPLYESCIKLLEAVTWISLGEIAKEEWAIYGSSIGASSGASRLGFFFW